MPYPSGDVAASRAEPKSISQHTHTLNASSGIFLTTYLTAAAAAAAAASSKQQAASSTCDAEILSPLRARPGVGVACLVDIKTRNQ
jgi:hypothetical protein